MFIIIDLRYLSGPYTGIIPSKPSIAFNDKEVLFYCVVKLNFVVDTFGLCVDCNHPRWHNNRGFTYWTIKSRRCLDWIQKQLFQTFEANIMATSSMSIFIDKHFELPHRYWAEIFQTNWTAFQRRLLVAGGLAPRLVEIQRTLFHFFRVTPEANQLRVVGFL